MQQGLPELPLQGPTVAKPGHGIEQGEATILQIGSNEGKDQHTAHHQQDQLPDLDPEQALAQLVEGGFPLLAGEDLIPNLLHLMGQAGQPDEGKIEGFPPLQLPGLHLGIQLLEFVKEPFKHLPQPMPRPRIGGLGTDQEHIQPVPQQVVIQAQGRHVERPGTVEAHIIEKSLGLLHYLADVPVGVAVEHVNELLVPTLQQQPPEGREEKQQGNGCKQQVISLSSRHGTTSMRITCQTMLLWMADTSMSGWAERGTSSQSGPLLRRVSGLSSW